MLFLLERRDESGALRRRHAAHLPDLADQPRAGGHALLVGVGGSGKQSLARLASFVNGSAVFQLVITARYGVNELKSDLQTLYRRAGIKGEDISFIFTDMQVRPDTHFSHMSHPPFPHTSEFN